MRRGLGLLLLSMGALLSACGGAPARADDEGIGSSGPLPTVGDESAGTSSGGAELTLVRSDGTFLEVGELRGHVVVLFVFATFDTVSQMTLTPLRHIAERYPDVRIVGIAAQPDARLLVDAYVHALNPPFPIAYDPHETVRAGESPIGELQAIPTIVVLDREGRISGRHVGFTEEPVLVELLAEAGAQPARR